MDRALEAEEEVLAVVDALSLRQAFPGLNGDGLARLKAELPKDWRFREFFFALKFSPSYELASRICGGEISQSDEHLPQDFDFVAATYRRFGDLRRVEFAQWWMSRGRDQFALDGKALPVVLGTVANAGCATDAELAVLGQALRQGENTSPSETQGLASLVIAVPLHGDRHKLAANILAALNAQAPAKDDGFRFLDNAVHHRTVAQSRRLLWARIVAPTHPLYAIGNRTGVSPINEHDERQPRRHILDQRRTMEILTSRQLRRAYNIVEQAARGRFPCIDPIEGDKGLRKRADREQRLDFDYPALMQRVHDYFGWLSEQLAQHSPVPPPTDVE